MDGVGPRSDYDETGLLALVAQLVPLNHQPIDKQKYKGYPLKKLAGRELNIANKGPIQTNILKTLKNHQLAFTQPHT